MIALAFKIGISLDDFTRLDVEAFAEAAKLYNENEEQRRRERWHMMRVQTSNIIRPHLTKPITPEDLIPLWFDGEEKEVEETPKETLSPEEHRERMKMLAKNFGNEI